MTTTAILPSQPFAFASAIPGVSAPFNLPTASNSILPVLNVAATYANGATGTLTVTASTDGGSTFAPVSPIAGSPASLTKNGTISVLQQPGMIFRVERAGGTGSISVSAGALIATAAMPWNGTVDPTSNTASFVTPLAPSSLLPTITVAAAFNSGLTGSLSLTASTDGGSTWTATAGVSGSPTTLTANGTITVLQQANTLYRLEGTVAGRGPQNNGTLTYNVSGPLPPFNMPLTAEITIPVVSAYVGFNSGAGSVRLTASTDGGQTFAPATDGGSALPALADQTAGSLVGVSILQQPGTIYRLDVVFTSVGSLGFTIFGCAIVGGGPSFVPPFPGGITVPAAAPRQTSIDQGFGTVAQLQKLYDTMRVPLADADLSGAITTYKAASYGALAADGSYTPAGTAIVKLSIPAAAQRAKQKRFALGLDRLIRAEYADVVSVLDEKGNALSAAYSFVDSPAKFVINGTAVAYAGTSYVPGARVTLRDPWVSGTLSGASPTPALTLPSKPTSTPAAFELRVTGVPGGIDTVTLTASTDGGATYAPVLSAMLAPYFGAPFASVSPAVIPLNGTLRVVRQANTLYRLERNAGSSPVTYYVGLLSSDWQHSMSNGAPVFASSTGAFNASTNASGIQCLPTLIEAAGSGLLFYNYAATKYPDLTALAA